MFANGPILRCLVRMTGHGVHQGVLRLRRGKKKTCQCHAVLKTDPPSIRMPIGWKHIDVCIYAHMFYQWLPLAQDIGVTRVWILFKMASTEPLIPQEQEELGRRSRTFDREIVFRSGFRSY